MPKKHEFDLRATARGHTDLQATRRPGPAPWVMGGVIFGGLTGATFVGPAGALAGMLIGGGVAALSVRQFEPDRP